MPCQPAGSYGPGQRNAGNRPPRAARSAEPALPELHSLSSEGAWILREPGFLQMRFLPILLMMLPAFAQQPAEQAKLAEQAKPAEQAPAAAPDEKAAASPAPSTESWINGSVDFGYRWVSDVGGNFQ